MDARMYRRLLFAFPSNAASEGTRIARRACYKGRKHIDARTVERSVAAAYSVVRIRRESDAYSGQSVSLLQLLYRGAPPASGYHLSAALYRAAPAHGPGGLTTYREPPPTYTEAIIAISSRRDDAEAAASPA